MPANNDRESGIVRYVAATERSKSQARANGNRQLQQVSAAMLAERFRCLVSITHATVLARTASARRRTGATSRNLATVRLPFLHACHLDWRHTVLNGLPGGAQKLSAPIVFSGKRGLVSHEHGAARLTLSVNKLRMNVARILARDLIPVTASNSRLPPGN
ncbi:hypothetical protein PRNP1_001184 [Phytophthora ramorum]